MKIELDMKTDRDIAKHYKEHDRLEVCESFSLTFGSLFFRKKNCVMNEWTNEHHDYENGQTWTIQNFLIF